MRYNCSWLKSIMFNGLFWVLKGNAVWSYFLQMNWLASKVLHAYGHNVNHFQMFIQIGGNCTYTDSRLDYGADLKAKRTEIIFNLLNHWFMQHLLKFRSAAWHFVMVVWLAWTFVPQYSFKIWITSVKNSDQECFLAQMLSLVFIYWRTKSLAMVVQ